MKKIKLKLSDLSQLVLDEMFRHIILNGEPGRDFLYLEYLVLSEWYEKNCAKFVIVERLSFTRSQAYALWNVLRTVQWRYGDMRNVATEILWQIDRLFARADTACKAEIKVIGEIN